MLKASLDAAKNDLLATRILAHKDKGVRIVAACCSSDLLRLYAPEAPYSEQQIKTLFAFLLRQVVGVGDSHAVYFPECYHLLESMCMVKSVTLLADINIDGIITELAQSFFDVISPETSGAVQIAMLELLHQLIEISATLPMALIEIILQQFTKSRRNSHPAAHKLACDLAEIASDKLQRYVCQYFADIILGAGTVHEDLKDTDLQEFRTSHLLMIEIHRFVPSLLLNVIQQVDEELKIEQVEIREFAVATIGEMLLISGARLTANYPQVWHTWNERSVMFLRQAQ